MKGKARNYERGMRISDRRKEFGLTQDELADRIGIGRQALSSIENGGDFKVSTLENLVSTLGVSEMFIMRGNIGSSKEELLMEATYIMSEMNEDTLKQFIVMMEAIKGTKK